ncbi:MAG: CHAT domain-containing protein [Chloroflexota bacterium]
MTIQLPAELLTTAETIEQVDDAQLRALIETYQCTPETIRTISNYINQGGEPVANDGDEDDADTQPHVPLYYTNPLKAEKLARLAFRIGLLMDYPGPPRGRWLLANAHMFTEQFNRAVELYQQARAEFLEYDDTLQAARMGVGNITALERIGKPQQALNLGNQIKPVLEQSEENTDELHIAILLMNMGSCYELLGQCEEALNAYTLQLKLAEKWDDQFMIAQSWNNQAQVLFRLNLISEALKAFQKAQSGFEAYDSAALELTRLHANLSDLHKSWGDYDIALYHLDKAETYIPRISEDQRQQYLLTWLRADIYLKSRRSIDKSLIKALHTVLEIFRQHGPALDEGQVHLYLGHCALVEGQWQTAEIAFDAARKLAATGDSRFLLPQVLHSLGVLAEQQQQIDKAIIYYQEAIDAVENLRRGLLVENFRANFLNDKLELYQDLIRIYAENEAVDSAFQSVERVKSRLLAERLAFRLASEAEQLTTSTDMNTRSLAQQLQSALEALDTAYLRQQYQQSDSPLSSTSTDEDTQSQIAMLEERVQTLVQQLQRDKPLFSPLATGDIAPIERIQQLLQGSECSSIFLQYQVVKGSIWVFVVDGSNVQGVYPLVSIGEISQVRQALYAAINRVLHLTITKGPAITARFLPALLADVNRLLHLLYQQLFAPIAHHIPNETMLIISPDSELHYIPFHALYDGTTYLLESHAMSYTPSATILDMCCVPVKQSASALIFGYDGQSPANVRKDGDRPHNQRGAETQDIKTDKVIANPIQSKTVKLTEVSREIDSVLNHVPTATYHQGNNATSKEFLQSASEHTLIHLAVHAQFRNDNPLLSSIQLADRNLTLAEIARLELDCDLAVLSGCETGYGLVQGAELLSLAGGFLGAGVHSLLVSLWRVDDNSTASMMSHFYEALMTGKTRAQAIRTAQRALLDEGRQANDHRSLYRHPAYWAPFVLNGNWHELALVEQES